jgi:hypothetical protein
VGDPGTDGGESIDAGADAKKDATADGIAPGCTPNNDGMILAAEIPLKAGLKTNWRFATNVTVSTAGQTMMNGTRKWDLSGMLTGDHARALETLSMSGTWYASSFPSATYALRLQEGSDLLGVFEVGANALSLQGVVSPADGIQKTNVAYNPQATMLQLPLQMGTAWKTTSNVTGMVSGVYSVYTETYDSQADARGTLVTPFGSFDVLRVRTVLTRVVGALPTVTRQFAFVTECFGTVATITSQPNETVTEFTNAVEVGRISP